MTDTMAISRVVMLVCEDRGASDGAVSSISSIMRCDDEGKSREGDDQHVFRGHSGTGE